jgi:hypothetical protein
MQELVSNQYDIWPELPYEKWKDTYATLHMYTQIVGKIELKLNPHQNHFWDTAFLVTPRGLSTYPIYYKNRSFDIEFNFLQHQLKVETSIGEKKWMPLETLSVSEFYYELMKLLDSLHISVELNTKPQEVKDGIPFPQDVVHHSYDRFYVENLHKILIQCDRLMKQFRSGYLGKCSPVHFFWGSFDMAVTRFSGRENSELHPEVINCGFWPGSGNILEPAFYAYSMPEPDGFKTSKDILPKVAFYNGPTKGYVLKYEDVRKASVPEKMVLDFFRTTYETAATLAHWDRKSLERNLH